MQVAATAGVACEWTIGPITAVPYHSASAALRAVRLPDGPGFARDVVALVDALDDTEGVDGVPGRDLRRGALESLADRCAVTTRVGTTARRYLAYTHRQAGRFEDAQARHDELLAGPFADDRDRYQSAFTNCQFGAYEGALAEVAAITDPASNRPARIRSLVRFHHGHVRDSMDFYTDRRDERLDGDRTVRTAQIRGNLLARRVLFEPDAIHDDLAEFEAEVQVASEPITLRQAALVRAMVSAPDPDERPRRLEELADVERRWGGRRDSRWAYGAAFVAAVAQDTALAEEVAGVARRATSNDRRWRMVEFWLDEVTPAAVPMDHSWGWLEPVEDVRDRWVAFAVAARTRS